MSITEEMMEAFDDYLKTPLRDMDSMGRSIRGDEYEIFEAGYLAASNPEIWKQHKKDNEWVKKEVGGEWKEKPDFPWSDPDEIRRVALLAVRKEMEEFLDDLTCGDYEEGYRDATANALKIIDDAGHFADASMKEAE